MRNVDNLLALSLLGFEFTYIKIAVLPGCIKMTAFSVMGLQAYWTPPTHTWSPFCPTGSWTPPTHTVVSTHLVTRSCLSLDRSTELISSPSAPGGQMPMTGNPMQPV